MESTTDIRTLLINYVHESLENDENQRAAGLGLVGSGIPDLTDSEYEGTVETLKDALADARLQGTVGAQHAERVLRWAGMDVQKGTDLYHRLCREVLKADLAIQGVLWNRSTGDDRNDYDQAARCHVSD